MSDDKARADIDRIAKFASKKTLPAHMQGKVDILVAAFREVQLAHSVEALVQWAYDEGFKDGEAGVRSDQEYAEDEERQERTRNQREYEGDYD
jgi:hypothetical protein